MRWAPAILLAGSVVAVPAAADEARVDVAGGRAGAVAIALARQTRSSIVIADSSIAARPVPAIRGRMSAEAAVRRLARAAGARAVAVAPAAWRLEPARAAPVRRAVAAATNTPAPARRPAPDPLPAPTIVVEGSKRDLPLERYAGAVSMIDGEALGIGGVGGTEKITQRVATVASTHLGSGRNKLFIRGIADSSFTGPTQATVGQYLGDLRLSYNAPDPDLRLSDIDHVEVLEGPQGALYGAGSLGGIIRVVPRMPQMDLAALSGMAGASLTQNGAAGADASATFNLPLAEENAALRVTLDAVSQGGYIDKPLLGRANANDTRILGGRAILRLRPAPRLTIDLIGFGQATRNRDSQYADRTGLPLTSSAAVREGSSADYAQGQVVVSADLGDVQLRSSTGITRQLLHERYDATPPGGAPRLFEQSNRTWMAANETRVWRDAGRGLGWLVGASLTHNVTRLGRGFVQSGNPALATGVRNRIDEATLYGQLSLSLVDGLTATAGGRLTHARLGGAGEDVSPLLAAARAEVTASRRETRFLPSASLLAMLRPGTTLFLRYEEGFRPGGLAIEGDFVRRFQNDHTATVEFGARHGRPDTGAFNLSFSLSYTRWQDIQADFIDGTGLPSSANVGDGHVWSASLSGGVQAAPGLRLEAGATFNRSRIDRPDPAALLGLFALLSPADRVDAFFERTTQIPNVAKFAGRAGFTYARALGGDLSLDLRGWASYVGRSRLGIGPELGELQGDYLDSGIDLRVGSDNIGVSLGLSNIANTRGNRFSLGTPFGVGRQQVTPLRPRTLRVGFDARF